nr:hypothetical protein [Shewanella ferrihydritica]
CSALSGSWSYKQQILLCGQPHALSLFAVQLLISGLWVWTLRDFDISYLQGRMENYLYIEIEPV